MTYQKIIKVLGLLDGSVRQSSAEKNKIFFVLYLTHPHILRHTGCTRMAEAGIDPRTLQDIMGHASMKMTMELYNHVTDERLMNEIQKLNDRRIS